MVVDDAGSVSPSTVYLAPKLKFKTPKKLGQLELVHSKVNRVMMYTKMNKMDVELWAVG